MMMPGAIGEYVWRVYDETRGRPLFIVRERHTRAPGVPTGLAEMLDSERSAVD
jgi:hypothetical protein